MNDKKKGFNVKGFSKGFLIGLIVSVIILVIAGIVKADTINEDFESSKINFIYTGKIVPAQSGIIESVYQSKSDHFDEIANKYFERYGYIDLYKSIKSRQLFGR